MAQPEVLIVGGGFSGLLLASKVPGSLVVEENPRVGIPPHCTGLVSGDTVGLIGSAARESAVASYRVIRVESLWGGELLVIRPRQRIYKLDRVLLEELLAKEAEDIGSRVVTKARASLVGLDGSALIREKGGFKRVSAPLVALAEGAQQRFSRALGLSREPELFVGVQGYASASRQVGEEEIVVFVADEVFKGFFGWLVPLGGGDAVVGMASKLGESLSRAMGVFLSTLRRRGYIGEPRLRNPYGGLILRSHPLPKHHRGRVIALGDAAGFAKPFTGGGLYPASKQVESLASALKGRDHLEALDDYYKSISGEILSLRLQWAASRAIERVGVERAVKTLSSLGLKSLALDYDHHERFLAAMVRTAR